MKSHARAVVIGGVGCSVLLSGECGLKRLVALDKAADFIGARLQRAPLFDANGGEMRR